jgi:hypothetical protein
MSRTFITEFEQLELRYRCSTCLAKRGEWCTTKRGNRLVTYLHMARVNQVLLFKRTTSRRSA